MLDPVREEAKREKEEKKAYDRLKLAIRNVLKSEDGYLMLWHIFGLCDNYSDSFTADRGKTDYLLGRQSIGLDIIRTLQDIEPTLYPSLLLRREKENGNRDDNND